MRAENLLRAGEDFRLTERILMELSDQKLREALLVSAGLFKQLKEEAIRRQIWERLRSSISGNQK